MEGRGNCQNGRRRQTAGNRGWKFGKGETKPRRAPGVAVFRGGVLTTGGFEAASSRLPAARAAYSPDLLGRGRHDGAISFPFFFCQPASSGLSGRGAESCGGSPLEAGSRTTRQRGWGLPPCFPRPDTPTLWNCLAVDVQPERLECGSPGQRPGRSDCAAPRVFLVVKP